MGGTLWSECEIHMINFAIPRMAPYYFAKIPLRATHACYVVCTRLTTVRRLVGRPCESHGFVAPHSRTNASRQRRTTHVGHAQGTTHRLRTRWGVWSDACPNPPPSLVCLLPVLCSTNQTDWPRPPLPQRTKRAASSYHSWVRFIGGGSRRNTKSRSYTVDPP